MIAALWQALTGPQRRALILLALVMLASALAELFALGAVIPFLAALGGGASEQVMLVTALFIVAALVAGAVRIGLAIASQAFIRRLAHQWAVEVQRRLLFQPYRFHLEHHSAHAVAMTDKVDQFAYGVVQPLIRAATGIVIGVALGLLLVIAAPIAALAVLGLLAIFYGAMSAFASRRLGRISTVVSKRYEQRVRIVQESFGGVRDLILDGLQGDRIARFAAIDRDIQDGNERGALFATAPRILIETGAMIAIALLALWLARQSGGLAPALPMLGLVALAGQRLLPLAQQVYSARTQLAFNSALTREVIALLRLPLPAPVAAMDMAFKREIRLDGLSFTYPGRKTPALRDVSLVIPRGARVGIVGPSGGGKSTLADLLMGLIEPDEGRVTIDDRALDEATTAGWQQHIGHVAQSVFLVDDSIARNIAIDGQPVDLDRLARAASASGVDSIVADLADGYDTAVGERGGKLSGGQRQRLAFARALYKSPAVLVLDEATSALDDAAERELLTRLAAIDGLTIILIAHRKSTVTECDLVFRVEKGRVSRA